MRTLLAFIMIVLWILGCAPETTTPAPKAQDDLLDLLGSENEIGKNKGGDIKRNMITLPLIYAKRKMSGRQNRILKNLLNQLKKNKNVLDKIINLIKEAGGIKYTTDKLDYFSDLENWLQTQINNIRK